MITDPNIGTGHWKFVAASVKGARHEARQQPCQDHNRVWSKGNLLFAIIADGAGSASRSEIGSRVATEVIANHLLLTVDQSVSPDLALIEVKAAFELAIQQIDREACELGISTRDLATTCTAVIASPSFIVGASVGDGYSLAKGNNGKFFDLFLADRGEYANETYFLSEQNLVDRLATVLLNDGVTALALRTDGLEPLTLSLEGGPYLPFYEDLFEVLSQRAAQPSAEDLASFLNSESIRSRSDDDLTIVIAVLEANNATS